jgi:hypothetical protein
LLRFIGDSSLVFSAAAPRVYRKPMRGNYVPAQGLFCAAIGIFRESRTEIGPQKEIPQCNVTPPLGATNRTCALHWSMADECEQAH